MTDTAEMLSGENWLKKFNIICARWIIFLQVDTTPMGGEVRKVEKLINTSSLQGEWKSRG